MRKAGWIALFFSIAGVLAAYWMTVKVFEGLPHVEDEMAYTWQAEVYARGQLTAPSPPDLDEMYVPFVVNHNGQRAAKYPPGWPMMLSFGVRLGMRPWVNPLLAGLAIWLIYRLGSKIFSRTIALLASFLTITSPFFLILSGSLHSSTFSLVTKPHLYPGLAGYIWSGEEKRNRIQPPCPEMAHHPPGGIEPGDARPYPPINRRRGGAAFLYPWAVLVG